MLAIAIVHFATLMALPMTLVALGSHFVLLPIAAGFVLEVLRGRIRRGLRKQVRANFLRDAALSALDKQALVPEAEVDSAFWSASLNEYAITVDMPAVAAAAPAAVCILGLAWPTLNSLGLASLLIAALLLLGAGWWGNRRLASGFSAIVEQRQRSAGWIAAAERDCGEIYGSEARDPFLAQLTRNVEAWSFAEDQVERKHLQHRVLLGVLGCIGVYAFLRAQGLDPLHWEVTRTLSLSKLSGVLLLGSGAPIAYVFSAHADSLLTTYATLNRLQPTLSPTKGGVHMLTRRPEALSARSLSFSYSASAQPVLTALSFDVKLAQITLISAPNGAGKTTLARLICGVLSTESGSLEIDGVPCADISRNDFGFVPQNPLIVEALSIEDNIRLVAPNASTESMGVLLRELGLERAISDLAGELSRGEQRRVAITRAILKQPRLLLLDEPDVWLDEAGRTSLARVLEQQIATRAVIVVSHRREWLPDSVSVIEL